MKNDLSDCSDSSRRGNQRLTRRMLHFLVMLTGCDCTCGQPVSLTLRDSMVLRKMATSSAWTLASGLRIFDLICLSSCGMESLTLPSHLTMASKLLPG